MLGIRKDPEYLYRQFDVLLKHATCEMKALQVQVYIKQWFHDNQRARFMQSLKFLVLSEMTSGMYFSAVGWLVSVS